MTQTYYKAFAPRVGIAWSPGSSGKTSIRAGWGMFYNPMEQLVLEQFGAEPPFGGSTYVASTFLNTPFVPQAGGYVTPNPFTGILSPKPGTPTDWASFRPMLLYGDFQPKMRTQYTAQYNFTIQRELARDLVLQVGYVGRKVTACWRRMTSTRRIRKLAWISPPSPITTPTACFLTGCRELVVLLLKITSLPSLSPPAMAACCQTDSICPLERLCRLRDKPLTW